MLTCAAKTKELLLLPVPHSLTSLFYHHNGSKGETNYVCSKCGCTKPLAIFRRQPCKARDNGVTPVEWVTARKGKQAGVDFVKDRRKWTVASCASLRARRKLAKAAGAKTVRSQYIKASHVKNGKWIGKAGSTQASPNL